MNSDFRNLVASLKDQYPRFQIKVKEDPRFIHFLNFFIKFFNPDWMGSFTVTLGYCVYMPQKYIDTESGYEILRHEAIHVSDFDRHPIWFPISYLFLLPMFYTMREYWELRGYRESMLYELEKTGSISDATINWLVEIFTGPSYFWMSKNQKRIKMKLESVRQELLTSNFTP